MTNQNSGDEIYSSRKEIVLQQPAFSGSLSPYQQWRPAPAEASGQLLEYWRVLRGHLSLLCFLGLLGFMGGFGYCLLQIPLYRARTVLDIRNLNESVLNVREATPAVSTAGNVLPEAYLQTEIKILQSESLLQRAIKSIKNKPTLAAAPEQAGEWWSIFNFGQSRISRTDLLADAAHRVKVRALGNTRIVEIICDARDPQIAAEMCNSLAQTYETQNVESRYRSTQETGQWLSSQLDNVKRRLTKAEAELRDSVRESGLMFDSEAAGLAQEKLRQLQAELSRAESERISRESQYEVAANNASGGLPSLLDEGPVRELRMKLTDLRRQLAEVSATMTPAHYKVREIKSQITELENTLARERQDALKRLRSEYGAAQRRETMTARAYRSQMAQVSEHADKAVHYNMLKSGVDSGRKLYESLLQRVEEVGLAQALRSSTITVVDIATPPGKPYSPNWVAGMGLGFILSTCVGMGFVLLRSKADRTLWEPGESARHLQVRELGVIPSARTHSVRQLLASGTDKLKHRKPRTIGQEISSPPKDEGGEARAAAAAQAHQPLELATWTGTPRDISDAFSATMNSLLFTNGAGVKTRVVVLTSPESGDGKTTVSTNLAIALANINRRVVLIDGDLRQPRLHELFGLDPTGGLSDLLEGSEPIDDVPLLNLVRQTKIKNLFVLPTRAVKRDIGAKLHSQRLQRLLLRLRREFDYILIDTPPMMYLSDARVLGWLAEGVLLIFRSGKTSRDSALSMQQCLAQDGICVLGTVLNDWDPRKSQNNGTYNKYLRSYAAAGD